MARFRLAWPAVLSALCLLMTEPVAAFSVGDATLHSSLGQPLRASIPLAFQSADELEALDTLRATLASQGEALPPGFLDVAVVNAGTGRQLLLTSRQPLLEPAATVALRVSMRGVSIVREFALLPDPVETPSAKPARTEPPAAIVPPPALPAAITPLEAPAAVRAAPAVAVIESSPSVEAPAAVATPWRRARRAAPRMPVPEEIPPAPAAAVEIASPAANATPAVTRFRLDHNFASYSLLKAQGLAPVPRAIPPEPAVTGTPRPAVVAAAAIEPAVIAEAGGGSWGLALAVIAGLLLLAGFATGRARRSLRVFWTRLRRQARKRRRPAARRPLPARPAMPASPAEEESNERSTHEDFTEGPAVPSATSTRPGSAPEASNDADVRLNHLRRRVQDVARRHLNAEARAQLTVVEAHIDLKRIDSAHRLLEQIERPSSSAATAVRLVKG